MTDEQAMKIISQMHGTDDQVNEALTIAEDCLEWQMRTNKQNKEYFDGKCPYTSKDCDDFHCWRCEVEKEEEEYARHCFEAKEGEDNEIR